LPLHFLMNERAHSTIIMASRKGWRDRTARTLIVKGTAAFLLLVFATILLHGNWPAALLWVSGGLGLWGLSEIVRQSRGRAEILGDVEAMSEEQFLVYAADLLRTQGYVIHKAVRSDNLHIDLLLNRGRMSFACRLQRQGRRIGMRVVAEALTGMAAYRCSRAMVLTTQRVTLPARIVARRTRCVLIDRVVLANLVVQYRRGHRVLSFPQKETTGLRWRK